VEPIIPSLHGFRSDPIGFAGGEYLPLPASKGLAFPFLLTSVGTPLLPANLRSEIMGSTQNPRNSRGDRLDKRGKVCLIRYVFGLMAYEEDLPT